MRWLVSALWVLLSLHAAVRMPTATDTGRGTICGTLLDENGQPAAFVGVAMVNEGPRSGPYNMGRTNAAGSYCVPGLAFGEYALTAADEEKGYPMVDTLFYAEHPPSGRVTISAERPLAYLNGRIPYRAGFLQVELVDAATGEPIRSMFLDMHLAHGAEGRFLNMRAPSGMVVLVPPGEDLYVNVSSPGYRTWPEDGSRGLLLNLLPGQRRTVKVLLSR